MPEAQALDLLLDLFPVADCLREEDCVAALKVSPEILVAQEFGVIMLHTQPRRISRRAGDGNARVDVINRGCASLAGATECKTKDKSDTYADSDAFGVTAQRNAECHANAKP
jgi:hypothetical protein